MPRHAARVPRVRPERLFSALLTMLLLAALVAAPSAAQEGAATATSQALAGGPAESCSPLQEGGTGGQQAAEEAVIDRQRPVYDYAVLIDVSRSMVDDVIWDGIPDETHPNIFGAVQEAINNFIENLPRGSNVVVIPFGDPVNPDNIRRYALDESGGRTEAQDYVRSLVADNGQTYITDSVAVALEELRALRTDDGRPHVQTVLLYTDGQGNGPGDRDANLQPSVEELLGRLGAYRADQPFLFVKYVALGIEAPNAEALEASGIVTVFEEEPGVVSDVREVRLAIPRADLGTIRPGDPLPLRLCAAAGDLGEGVPLRLSLNQDGLPADLSTVLAPNDATLGPDGVEMILTVRRPERSASEGRQTVEVRIESGDPLVIPAPAAIPVSFLLAPPPTPTPVPTATPFPTSTPTPSPTPTATPVPPTATPTPSPTPSPTPTPVPPTPTPTPIPPTSTPTPIPPTATPTPTPIPVGRIDLGPWNRPEVSTTGDPDALVEWTAPLTAEVEPGAAPVVRFELDARDPPFDPAPVAALRAGGAEFPEIALDGMQPEAEVVVRMSSGALQRLGNGDPHAIGGRLVIEPRGAEVVIPDGVTQPDGAVVKPVTLEARVYTPRDWGAEFRRALPVLGGLVGIAASALLWRFAGPGLPRHAAIEMDGQRYPIPRGGGSVGGAGDTIDLSLPQTAGTIKNGWLKRARFTVAPDNENVERNGASLQAGQTVTLSGRDQFVANGAEFSFTKRQSRVGDGGDGN